MITKERLREILDKNGSVYTTETGDYGYGYLELILYDSAKFTVKKNNTVRLFVADTIEWHWYKLENLFETEEDARWELEMTATRIEILKLPHFNEVCDGCIHDITFIDNKKCKWQLTISDNGIALLDFALLGRDKFWNKLTKENYISACLLCKKLFLGENDDK